MRAAQSIAILVGLGAASAGPLMAQTVGPPAPPRITANGGCQAAEDPDEMVVCGRDEEDSPYRIPRELREQPIVEDRNASWDAQFRDMQALERFSSQNVGPSGMSQHSRQVDCQWRAARQVAQGRRPDCGRSRRSGE